MKLRLMTLAAMLVFCAANGASAQDWRRIDPTAANFQLESNPAEVEAATGELGFNELPVTQRRQATSERREYTRSDTWQVASRSRGGGLSLDQNTTRASQHLPDSKKPWSSTYFPFQECDMAFKNYSPDGLSPMELYDTYVFNSKGKNPGATAWEASTVAQTLVVGGQRDFGRPGLVWKWKLGHNMAPWMVRGSKDLARIPYTDRRGDRRFQTIQVDWWGHCNGWAAASVLVPEPPRQLTIQLRNPVKRVRLKSNDRMWPGQDKSLGKKAYETVQSRSRSIRFTGADLKALYSEAFLSTAARLSHPSDPYFYRREDAGQRYDPERGGSQAELDAAFRDILPHNFHRIMLDHMEREKGIVAEKDADEHVNNLPVVGWQYIRSYNSSQHSYDFVTRVQYADYTPPTYRGTKLLPIDYKYRIYLDRNNRVTRSEWLGKSVREHPDFIWVPDRPIPAPLKRNPAIKLEILDEIMRTGKAS